VVVVVGRIAIVVLLVLAVVSVELASLVLGP